MRRADRRDLSPRRSAGAHGRRKFYELADIAANKRRGKRAPPISPLALEAVKRIDALFDIEREINGETAERRLAVRRERSAPLVAELEDWMRMERAGLSRHASAGQGHGLYAEALGQLRPLPRRRPHLPYEQRRRAGAARYLPSEATRGCSPAPTAGACGPLSCTRSSAPRSSTTSTRRPGSPMSSTVSPTCRRPVCTSFSPGTGRPTGNRTSPHSSQLPPNAYPDVVEDMTDPETNSFYLFMFLPLR